MQHIMSNPVSTPTVDIQLDKPRKILYDFNSLVLIEEQVGIGFNDFIQNWKPNLKTIRIVLWAGLVHEDSGLTLDQVGKIIPVARMGEVSTKVTEAMRLSMGTTDDPTPGDTRKTVVVMPPPDQAERSSSQESNSQSQNPSPIPE